MHTQKHDKEKETDKIRLCLSWVKTYKKADAFMLRKTFSDELIDAGMPESVAELLTHQDIAQWVDHRIDCDVVFVAQILFDEG